MTGSISAPDSKFSRFSDLHLAAVHPEDGSISSETANIATLVVINHSGDTAPVIVLEDQATRSAIIRCELTIQTAWRAAASLFYIRPQPATFTNTHLYALRCSGPSGFAAAQRLSETLDAVTAAAAALTVTSTVVASPPNGSFAPAPAATTGNGTIGGCGGANFNAVPACHSGRRSGTPPPAAIAAQQQQMNGVAIAATTSPRLLPPASPSPGAAAAETCGTAAAEGAAVGPGPPGCPQQHRSPAPSRSPCHGSSSAVATAMCHVQAVQQPHQSPSHPQQQQQQTSQHCQQQRDGVEGSRPREGSVAPAGEGGSGAVTNHFDRKICRASSDMYFHYYGMLQHQQNMLQDYTRTGTYYAAIVGNPADFAGRTVLDVGAGSGILSLFAATAGAARVYAVEASGMAAFARRLADANPALGSRITVIQSKVEELSLPERVDILVSEPMGTLLVNERMLESYIYARDAFLKPGGKMFPQLGRIHAAAFSDEVLHSEIGAKSSFWMQRSFYGVDVTALHEPANEGYYGQVVVDAFEPSLLVSSVATRPLDFGGITESELLDIDMPLQLVTGGVAPVTVHGLACWFDVFFAGAQQPVWLTTAPGMPTTHWFQLRCVLQKPLVVTAPGTPLIGRLRLLAHARQSYDITLTLTAPPLTPGGPPQTSSGKFDLKEPYYRQLTPYGAAAAAATMGEPGQGASMGEGEAVPASGCAGGWGW